MMKDNSELSGGEFSVRDQFAGTGPAKPLPAHPAAPVHAGEPSSRPDDSSLPPLRRPLTAENLLSLIDWAQLAQGLWRRAWIILLLTAIGLGLGLYGRSRVGVPRYEARASVLYRTDRQKQALSAPGTGAVMQGLARATATSLLRRAGNLETVIANLDLEMGPEELGWRVQTQSDRHSEIILLRVEFMPSAETAIATANEVVRVGIEDNHAFYRNQALQMVEQFKQQAASAAAEANAAREALITYQTRHQLLEVGADTKAFLDSMGAVSERLHAARIARDSHTVRIANYRRLIADLPDEVMRESFEDNPLKRRIANAEVALMEARTRYGPENPRILQMEDSIREMRRTMNEQSYDETRERVYVRNPAKAQFEMEVLRLEAEQEVLDRSVSQIEQQAADLERRYAHLPAQQIELAGFHQRHAAAEALLQRLERSITDARMTTELDLGDFEPLEAARSATASRGKLAVLLPAATVLASLFAGLGLCAVLALADPKLKSAGHVKRLYTLPCLGTVPTVTAEALPSAFLKICRDLYPRMTRLSASGKGPVFTVMSALSGDGKSTLAYHAARYWAALGVKTAYLDFDAAPNPWLRPEAPVAGLEDYLAGRVAWDDVLIRSDEVSCFKRQRDTGNLPEQMHGSAMRRLMETLRAQYACIIIEAPAWMTDESSAGMLANMTDQSVWMAASPVSTRPVIGAAFDGLDRAGVRPVGMILNQAAGPRTVTPPSSTRRKWTFLTLIVGLLAAGCRSTPPRPGTEMQADNVEAETPGRMDSPALPNHYFLPYDPSTYTLAIGDRVEISVFGFPETVMTTPVAPDGALHYLFMDGVPAAGRTPSAVAQEMEAALGNKFNHPTVSILPVEFSENRFLALGKVVYPNTYPLDSALTLRQAIARAGGLAQGIYRGTTIELASLRDSFLLRDGRRVPVDFEALIHHNDASQDIYLRPGDVIYVSSGLGREVFLMGAVGEQKATAFTDGMTLVELIAGASERGGGYARSARLGKVLVVRGALDDPTSFNVDLGAILRGRAPDVFLMPGDIVYVPEKPFRFTRELTRAVILTFVRTFAAEAGAALVDETIFLTPPPFEQGPPR